MVETNWPSLPYNRCPDCDVYALSDGTYLVDDTGVVWPPPSGDGYGGTVSPAPADTTNVFKLEIKGLSNGVVNLVLHGTSSGTAYTIFTRTSLSPKDPWYAEMPLIGADSQDNSTPFQVPILLRGILFFRAEVGTVPPNLRLYSLGISDNTFNVVLNGTTPSTHYVLRSTPSISASNTWAFEAVCVGAAGQYWTPVSISLTGRPSLFLSAQAGVDSDGDGMPDWWELLHGLNPLDPSDANLDPDDDGLSNLQEYQDGGNPFDPMFVAWGDNANGESSVPWGFGAVTAIAGGGGRVVGGHTLVLTPQGTVIAWGANNFGQTNVPSGLTNVLAVAAGGDQSAALRADGTVVQWGRTFADVPTSLTNATAISAGYQHILGLQAGGTVVTWGRSNCPANTVPSGLIGVKAIAAGWNHNVALRSNGTVVVWGLGGESLRWNLTNAPAGLTDVASIAAGALHSVALRSNGMVVAWGCNVGGETNVPSNLANIVAVAAGRGYTLALARDGTVTNWGPGLPVPPTPLDQIRMISAGPAHVLAVRQGLLTPMIVRQPRSQAKLVGAPITFEVGAWSPRQPAYQWQLNGVDIAGATNTTLVISSVQDSNQGRYRARVTNGAGPVLSDEARLVRALSPVIVSPLTPQVAWVPPGGKSLLSVSATAQGVDLTPLSYLWYKEGLRIPWALSDSNLVLGMFEPVREGQYSVVVTNIAGSTSSVPWTVRLMNPGTAVAWGDNTDGLANPPFGMSNILAVASGQHHAVALIEGGTVVAWGNNDYGQTNVPANATNVVAIACGSDHTLVLRADGTVRAWGRDDAHQAEVPADLTNVVAIAAGGLHNLAMRTGGGLRTWPTNIGAMPANLTNVTAIAAGLDFDLALRADGTVVAWDGGDYGQTNVPLGLTNVVAISAGDYHGLALKTNGTVVAWGSNSAGQTNVPPDLTNAMAIAAGASFSVALRNDGTVVAWGDNTFGQTNVPSGLSAVKTIAASGTHTLAALFSPLVQYPINVTNDLLVIYNTNSPDGTFVKDYYLANRPMVAGANVTGISFSGFYISNYPGTGEWLGVTNTIVYETISPFAFTNQILNPVLDWLGSHPTRRPQYVVLFLDVPTRVYPTATNPASFPFYGDSMKLPSVSYQLANSIPGWKPFITHINMDGTNDCVAYINKLAALGTNYPRGTPFLSASAGRYGNTNYYIDDTGTQGPFDFGLSGASALLQAGVPTSSVIYTNTDPDCGLACHITRGSGLAGYFCWGMHSSLGPNYAFTDVWTGDTGWWIIETAESYNGDRYVKDHGHYTQWFSPNAFGGVGYSNTPIGSASHTDEPGGGGVEDPAIYFVLWAQGKSFAICAWNSRMNNNPFFQATGDPLVTR
jgi:alpha-tubulin suppressor-like RCC1 family protein